MFLFPFQNIVIVYLQEGSDPFNTVIHILREKNIIEMFTAYKKCAVLCVSVRIDGIQVQHPVIFLKYLFHFMFW